MARACTLAFGFALVTLLARPAGAQELLDGWIASLDPARPAGGEVAVYDGGPAVGSEQADLFLAMLWSPDQRVAGVAADELTNYGVPGGEAALLAVTEDPRWSSRSPDLRATVLRGLREMRSGRALVAFAKAALEEGGPVSREGIRGLCALQAPQTEPVLRLIAEQGDRQKQSWIVRSLRQAGARDAAKTARTEVRLDRREGRSERRDDRKETRTERREDRKETRTERRDDRKERREDRKETRGDSDDDPEDEPEE
jgi:hypothetical protein